jgi:3'-phosphoadenosine 5'-phosphosulfate sulfotransferase (PAPS reductase)/FAD synthetase
MIAMVSVSGGKDSTATLLLAMERLPKERIFPVFADTGNEHAQTYAYVDYLERVTGLPIKRLKADFTERWWKRRDYVRDHWTWKEKRVSRKVQTRALAILEKGPSGNPFLDLCVIKGRFPSRMAQFCTQELKKFPLIAYTMDLVEEHGEVESWQGVRADESASRAKLPEREAAGEPFTVYRPILRWNVEQVFAQHKKHGIKPNPLYKQGMGRVGCMPCINVSKDELLQISKRFPERIDMIEEWEAIVGSASKRGASTFFVEEEGGAALARGIRGQVMWARTEHGGKQYDWTRFLTDEPPACASSYGLCEAGWAA